MTLTAVIDPNTNSTVYTESIYQHAKNTTIIFEGIDLPEKYSVHFSNEKERGISVICEGDQHGVKIPDELLSTGSYVYAWLCISGESDDRSARYCVVTPVIPRPVPIPSTSSSSGSGGKIDYEIDEDDENLIFHDQLNRAMTPTIEEEI